MKIYKYILLYLLITVYTTVNLSLTTPTQPKELTQINKIFDENQVDFTYKKSIKSVQLKRADWDLGYPILDAQDQLPLVLTFDDLSDDPVVYTYTLTHCDANWQPTGIIKTDYLDGMHEEEINDYEFSRNTHQNYIHYKLQIPNREMRPTLAGNYIIEVYEDFDPEQKVLSRRFLYVNNKTEITGEAIRTNNLNYFYSHQEVDFTVFTQQLAVDNPNYNIQVVVLQNFDWQQAKYDLKPTFTAPGELIYNYEEENLFPGLSEFRQFDLKNLNYVTPGIDFIRFERPLNHAYLLPDKPRSGSEYYFDEDINGAFVVSYHLDYDPATAADYVMVHFKLPFDGPMNDGSIYVYGGLSDWSITERCKMTYNADIQSYELPLLLKQGYYNYQFRYIPESGYIDPSFFEGSYFETENDYLILVYYKSFSKRYQELVGYLNVNSVKKNQE